MDSNVNCHCGHCDWCNDESIILDLRWRAIYEGDALDDVTADQLPAYQERVIEIIRSSDTPQ